MYCLSVLSGGRDTFSSKTFLKVWINPFEVEPVLPEDGNHILKSALCLSALIYPYWWIVYCMYSYFCFIPFFYLLLMLWDSLFKKNNFISTWRASYSRSAGIEFFFLCPRMTSSLLYSEGIMLLDVEFTIDSFSFQCLKQCTLPAGSSWFRWEICRSNWSSP